jgi:hypothetical protein
MTFVSKQLAAAAGDMSHGKMLVYTYTTTAAAAGAYEVIDTIQVSCLPGVHNTLTVTTNNLLFKFEYTRDGVNWVTTIEDFPVSAGATAMLTAVRNASQYRVSVKPAVAGNHGTVTWIFIANTTIIPPEYRAAFAYEDITVSNAHYEPLTVATMDGAFSANITVEDNPVRVRWDGGNPTTSIGHLLQSGDQLKLDFTADLWHFKAIATGGDSKLRVTYSK